MSFSLNARPLHALLATSTCTTRVRAPTKHVSALDSLIRRHTRQPLSSLHICASTHPSTCEHQHDTLRCMARGWQAWLRYQWNAARAKRETSRALAIVAAHASSRRLSSAKRRRTAFFSGPICLRAVFNGEWAVLWYTPLLPSTAASVRCRGSARAFAASLLHLSEKQRSTVGKDHLPVQRV